MVNTEMSVWSPMEDENEGQWLEQVRTTLDRPWTAGNLNDFNLCPRKLLLSLFSQSRQRRALGASQALQGAVRAALVAADQQGGVGEWSLEKLRDEFLHRFDKAACADSLEEEQTERLGINMLARFQAEQRGRTAELLAVDERYEAIFEGLHFAAVADRVERDADGKLVVARYDVTSKPPGPERLKKEFSMGLLIAIVAATRDEIPSGRIYALRPGKVYDVTLDEAELVVVRGRAIMAARLIQADTDFGARAGDGCRWCRVRSSCTAWQSRRRSLLDAGGA
jgi:hypothetical protein